MNMNMEQQDIGFSFQEPGVDTVCESETVNKKNYLLVGGMAVVIVLLGVLTFLV